MSGSASGPGKWPNNIPLQPLQKFDWSAQRPTHHDADPGLIAAVLDRTQARPSGNWFVIAASDGIGTEHPIGVTVAGVELVAWRDRTGRLIVGPGACPHLGAPLARAALDCGALRCRWHGLRIAAEGVPGWTPWPSHDDGVLAWVRLDHIGRQTPTPAPIIGPRPPAHAHLAAVTTMVGVCEPVDIVANRLDPWHGAWFHPYSFTHLDVLETPDPDSGDRFVVAVTFRVGRRLGVPVRAEFTSPEPRTVVMRILDGEGADSVVETHATALGPGPDGRPRTAVIEAVLAFSPRSGFTAARRAAPMLRPLMRRAAARLWRDDLAYAERRYELRTTQVPPHR
ncbi:DUF5914 domain-containing protein [Rhodococcus sp. NPDC060090]|uniref:DUF5914 domain-containing protein n=1 Tax=Rhodococcus sp. NPDC060090 TaxID=3347056 RepID=UPI0036554A06